MNLRAHLSRTTAPISASQTTCPSTFARAIRQLRGTIGAGAFADIVLFDPAAVRDTATFDEPHTYPDGFSAVIVNGTVAWEPGATSIERAGRALRR